ncbi:MAG: VanZ family protein [Myxococcota bacterium]
MSHRTVTTVPRAELWRAWLPPLALMLVIVLLSSIQGQPRADLFDFPHRDKVLHLSIYAVLGALLLRALWMTHPRLARPAVLLVVVCWASGFGAFDEFYQGLVPYRSPDVWDWAFDSLGGLLGGGWALGWRLRTRRLKGKAQLGNTVGEVG